MPLMKSNLISPENNEERAATDDWLHEVELFRELEPAELESFLAQLEKRTYPAGSIIFTPEDSDSEQLYILREGQVDLFRLTTDGKRLVTRRTLPGQVFGVMGLLGRTMQGNFAQAITEVIVFSVTREHVLALMKKCPDFAVRMLETLGKRLRLLEERLTEAAYSPAMVRIANFLLSYADLASGVLADITQEEIANTVGAVRQTVAENLGVLRRKGLILTKPKEIRIINRKGLEEFIRSL